MSSSDTKIDATRRTLVRGAGLGLAGAALFGASRAAQAEGASQTTGQELAGKVAIVTGARANIGRGIAIGLAEMGARVLVHYHRAETVDQAEETARLARKAGAPQTALAVGDLSNPALVARMFDIAETQLGGVDILVHNAGAIIKKSIAETTDEEFERCHAINARGSFYCMREGARRIRKRGRIINIVTSLSPSMTPNYGAYASSKSAQEQLTRTLSKEIGGKDRMITVNSVHPGPIDTPFFHAQETERSVAFIANLANEKRLGTVEDIVPMVQFLASPNSQWMSGESLYLNGGYAQA